MSLIEDLDASEFALTQELHGLIHEHEVLMNSRAVAVANQNRATARRAFLLSNLKEMRDSSVVSLEQYAKTKKDLRQARDHISLSARDAIACQRAVRSKLNKIKIIEDKIDEITRERLSIGRVIDLFGPKDK